MSPSGRRPSIATWQRRLAAAQRDLVWALQLPHPYPGRQRQRVQTLAHKIRTIKAAIRRFTPPA